MSSFKHVGVMIDATLSWTPHREDPALCLLPAQTEIFWKQQRDHHSVLYVSDTDCAVCTVAPSGSAVRPSISYQQVS